jgi:ATP-dependent RNA helicase DeaD
MEFRELQRIKKSVSTEIQLHHIPSLGDVKKANVVKLVDSIRKQPLNDAAGEILQALEEEMDISQIAFKLISMTIEQQKIAGPEHIGINPEKIAKMLDRLKHDKGGSRGRGGYRGHSRGRGGHSGGRRSGQGGGGRSSSGRSKRY